MKTITKFTIAILIFLVIVFLIPYSIGTLVLDKEKILEGEYWRLATYPFVHFNLVHLAENLIGLTLVGLIALELKTKGKHYIPVYFSSAILVILPLWIMLNFIAAGSSSAIYALFGFISFKMKKFGLKPKYILMIISIIIFIKTIYYFAFNNIGNALTTSLIQDSSHFSGLVFGVALYGVVWSVKDYHNKRANFLLRGMK